MQKLFKIRIEFFYIAFFRAIGWLLSGHEMEIVMRKLCLVEAKSLPKPAAIPISCHGIAVLRADGKREARALQLVFLIKKYPVPGNPLLGIFPEPAEIRALPDAVRLGKTEFLPGRLGLTWNQS